MALPIPPSLTGAEGYPDAAAMPEVNGQADEQSAALAQGAPNPVIKAMSTIAQFVMSLPDQNSPMKTLFTALVEEFGKMVGGQGPAQPEQEQPPETPATPFPEAPASDPSIGGMGSQMNANKGAKLFV